MDTRKNKISTFIVVFFGVLITLSIFAYTFNINVNSVRNFAYNKKNAGEKLYSEIVALDFENNYPVSPKEVVKVFSQCAELIYGGIIVNDELTSEVLFIQRKLYSDNILDKNDYTGQLNKLIDNMIKINELGIYTYEYEIGNPIYDPTDQLKCAVPVTQKIRRAGEIDLNFYLVKQNEQWKVDSIHKVD